MTGDAIAGVERKSVKTVRMLKTCFRLTSLVLLLVLLSGCGSATIGKAVSETDRVTAYESWGEEAMEMLKLTNGTDVSRTAFTFAYQTNRSFSSLRVYYTLFRNGERMTDAQPLLRLTFTDGLPEYPRAGKIMIDVQNGYASVADEYYVMAKTLMKNGELSEKETPLKNFYCKRGSFLDEDFLPLRGSIQSAYGAGVTADYPVTAGNVVRGEPICLLWFGQTENTDVLRDAHGRSAEDILADPQLLAGYEAGYFFYCIFE